MFELSGLGIEEEDDDTEPTAKELEKLIEIGDQIIKIADGTIEATPEERQAAVDIVLKFGI